MSTTTFANTYASLGLRVWASVTIEGTPIDIDVHSVECVYKINEIPTCQIQAALGREAVTGGISNASILRRITFQVPIVVFLQVTKTSSSGSGLLVDFAGKTFILFAGFISNVQYIRDVQDILLRISAIHWLHALNFSSALSQQSHPANPMDLIFGALINMGAGSRGGLAYVDAFQQLINPIFLAQDMWGMAILPWLINLTRMDFINSVAFHPMPFNDSPNGMCFWALKQFHPTWPGLPVRTDSPESAFMLMNMADILAGRLASSDGTAPVDLRYSGIANKTIWQILAKELAPLFFFAVVPLPTMALVVPHVSSLRFYYQPYPPNPYTILTRDIFSISITADKQQAIRALGLFAPFSSFTGSVLQSTDEELNQGVTRLIGGFHVSTALHEGMVIYKRAPAYVSNLAAQWFFGPMLFAGKRRNNRRPMDGREIAFNIRALREKQNLLLDDLAQLLYNDELLRDRTGIVETALRFDICPGSTIAIEGVGENYLGPAIYESSRIFAFVQSVAFSINALPNRQYASTIFEISHIRNNTEQLFDDFTIHRHPLYDSIFLGIPMMNGPI